MIYDSWHYLTNGRKNELKVFIYTIHGINRNKLSTHSTPNLTIERVKRVLLSFIYLFEFQM